MIRTTLAPGAPWPYRSTNFVPRPSAEALKERAEAICGTLAGTAMTATELAHIIGLPSSQIRRSLGNLVDAGVVQCFQSRPRMMRDNVINQYMLAR